MSKNAGEKPELEFVNCPIFNANDELDWVSIRHPNYFITNTAFCIYVTWLNGA